ncbi:MAG: helix-turn-helix domain-containing protein [Gammaproteobacteria bacterium]
MASTAQLLKRIRTEAGLTQAELARRLGTTQTAVSRLERWDANPRIATLERAIRATGNHLQLQAVPAPADVDEEQIAAHLRMTPAERAQAHDAAYRNVAKSARAARRID